MYELVKKKNTGIRIISAIVILLVVTSILKEIAGPRKISLNDELIQLANDINRHTPVIIDSTTRFDNVAALTDYRLQFNYTLLADEKQDIDTVYLKETGKQYMVNMLKSNPQFAAFRNNKIGFLASYSDKNGVYICTISVVPDDYR